MMAEKKKGFLQRLFGGGDTAPPAPPAEPTAPATEPSVESELEADILLDELVQAAPLVLPPEEELALAAALHEEGLAISPTAPEEPQPPTDPVPPVEAPEPPVEMPSPEHELAGPPEATVDYIEEVEADEAAMPEPVPEVPEPAGKKPNWFQRLATGLKRSSDQLTGGITSVFTRKKLDEAMLEELEDLLIQSDFGLEMAATVTGQLRRDRFDRDISTEEVRAVLAEQVRKVLEPVARPLVIEAARKPFVILTVGVNGSGKTTTIGKLSSLLRAQGKTVMLAAGDTFRAAAIEQLQVWGERTGAPVVAKPPGSDASGLAFEAVTRAKEEGADVLIIDTAGRLHNRDELMSELEKIIRVIKKVDETAPHATLLTLDATTGQNALNQVEIFGKRAGVTGLVMTKLDGTARGGILVAIAQRFGLPVHFIGVGEGVDNIEPFAAADFAAAIAGKH
jgi:fused signal recognition particle receptor